jgi:hypothetical protein
MPEWLLIRRDENTAAQLRETGAQFENLIQDLW